MTPELYKLFLQMAIIGGITGILGFLSEKYQGSASTILRWEPSLDSIRYTTINVTGWHQRRLYRVERFMKVLSELLKRKRVVFT